MADQGAEGLLSPYLRRKRIAASAPYLAGKVLDFGCGSGSLAQLVDPRKYLGVDVDSISLEQAKSHFPSHRFSSELPHVAQKFDTIVCLAVLEHVRDPLGLLKTLATHLKGDGNSHLVVTTPHPSVDMIHKFGATLGLFSKEANAEHETLLGKSDLLFMGNQAGLTLVCYSRFLFGANQIAVYARAKR